ncbi:PP2C family protein-serine/threonine phosphatase [Streptomyces griseofuscus]|uniref:PP2C family protein-serine/threonine phosphatase n=1 Tax=Streptomyces griseofuscus TaxID=146922 RepID=UPI0036C6BD29
MYMQRRLSTVASLLRARDRGPRRDPVSPQREGWRLWLLAAPLVLIAAIVLVDVLTPSAVTLTPFLVVAPASAASFASFRFTAAVGVLAVVADVATDLEERPPYGSGTVSVGALVVLTAVVMLMAHVRERYSQRCEQAQSLALVAQRAVLRPLPTRLGRTEIASAYLAAEAEAVMGGDLYAAARIGSTTRLMIGDVRGKGMNAVGEAALVLGAFHATAHRTPSLGEVAATMDSALGTMPEPESTPCAGEEFVTAMLLDVPDQDGPVKVALCGHPPAVVVRDGRAITPALPPPAPPLGLGFGTFTVSVGTISWAPGDIVLLCTDGVLEARDGSGRFYPLRERIDAWPGNGGPGGLVAFLRADLLGFTGGKTLDDAALVAFSRAATARLALRSREVAALAG